MELPLTLQSINGPIGRLVQREAFVTHLCMNFSWLLKLLVRYKVSLLSTNFRRHSFLKLSVLREGTIH